MNPEEYQRIQAVESGHFYFRGRRQLLGHCLNGQLTANHTNLILDVGCGTGAFATTLQGGGRIVGLDISQDALNIAKDKPYGLLGQGSVNELPYKDNTFDLVVAIEVLYHRFVDEAIAWAELKRVCKPGGRIVTTHPAFNILWGEKDVAVFAKKRYRLDEVRKQLEGCGLDPILLCYTHICLFLPMLLARKFSRLKRWILGKQTGTSNTSSNYSLPNYWINQLAYQCLKAEYRMLPRFVPPFGITVLCICLKES